MAARNVRSGIALFQLFLYKYILEFRRNFNEKRLKMAIKPHKMHYIILNQTLMNGFYGFILYSNATFIIFTHFLCVFNAKMAENRLP